MSTTVYQQCSRAHYMSSFAGHCEFLTMNKKKNNCSYLLYIEFIPKLCFLSWCCISGISLECVKLALKFWVSQHSIFV